MKLWFSQNLQNASSARAALQTGSWRCEQAWWLTMGFAAGPPPSLDQVEKRFRRLASTAHPDRGGSDTEMQALVKARSRARQQYRRA